MPVLPRLVMRTNCTRWSKRLWQRTNPNPFAIPALRPLASSSSFSSSSSSSSSSSTKDHSNNTRATSQSWNDEWKKLGLGARLPTNSSSRITNLLFVQMGFGVDQHGRRERDGATKAAVRAVRNAIEFNSIPGVIEAVPGGRSEMLIQVLLGVPPSSSSSSEEEIREGNTQQPLKVDLESVAKVFPYGRLLPIQVVVGGLSFPTGRIVEELGDQDDMAICVAACVSIGYDNGDKLKDLNADNTGTGHHHHKTYSTKDGF